MAPENNKIAAWANGKPAILLAVLKQPGANVIETVDRIKALLPQLQAAIPTAVKVDVLSDRTTTIRASVGDVQFTLMLTIALVVMVIFIFLRSFWATVDSERDGAVGADRVRSPSCIRLGTASITCR